MFNYNIHPLVVHFPIAFLFVYSIIKVLPLKRWFPNVAWRQIERILLVVGVLGAFAALLTGDTTEHIIQPNHALVDAHSNFGVISTFIYGALLIGEIAAILNGYVKLKISFWLEKIFCNPVFAAILAVAGLVCISLTGLLGGVIAQGVGADPVAPIVLKLLGITL